MIVEHKEYLPSFGIGYADQKPVCIYTILSINEQVRDCAAYRGVGPCSENHSALYNAELLERIRGGGQKVNDYTARELFTEIETMGLHYRR